MTAVPRQPLMEARSDDTRDGRSFYPSNIVRTNRIRAIFDRASPFSRASSSRGYGSSVDKEAFGGYTCIDMREREREVVLGTLRNRSDNNKREREVQKGEREYNLPCARKPGFYTIVAHVGS